MKKLLAGRSLAALVLWGMTVGSALASGETGTGAVAEMDVGVGTLLKLIGGIMAMGVVIWLITKLASKAQK